MGNKNGGKKKDTKLTDLTPFENGYSNITVGQIGTPDSKAPVNLPIQQAHVITADDGGHRGKVYCLGWAKNDSTLMVTGSQDGKLLFFSASAARRVQEVPLSTSWIKSVDMSSQGDSALCGTPDGPMIVRTGLIWTDGKLSTDSKRHHPQIYQGHENGVNDVKYTGENNFVTGSGDYKCAYWDVDNTSEYIHAFEGHAGDVNAVAVFENSFISGSCDCSAKLWDIRSQDCVRTYEGHDADVNTVAISPDGLFLATGSGDSSCLIYDIRSDAEPLLKIEHESFSRGVESIAFSPHGFHLVVGYENEAVRIWNLNHNRHEVLNSAHTKKIGQVAFSPDGRFLGICSHDQSSSIYTTPLS